MFRGSIVALVTPLLNDEVDVERLRELVEIHVQAGTHAIVAGGTTGEAGTLTRDEKLLVIKTVVEQVNERIPVIAGTAANSTKACIELTQLAMSCGVHAALIMTPTYIKPTQDGLYQHYSQIAHAVPIPIILYNVPSRTACDLLPKTVGRLSAISNIIGIKEAVSDLARLHDLVQVSGGNVDIYTGNDNDAANWMSNGAKGVISVVANVAPVLMAKLCDAMVNGDKKTGMAIQEQLLSLNELLFTESNPIPVKWALFRMGLMNDEIRLPLTRLAPQYRQALEQELQTLQLI